MFPVIVHARAGISPRGVEDLCDDGSRPLERDWLVAAGQAMTWRSPFTSGSLTAIPLTAASAVLLSNEGGSGPEQWHDRFTRGLAHRMAGELTIASVSAGLLGEAGRAADGEDAELLGSALDGLARLLTDLADARMPAQTAGRIVADTVRTHNALLGGLVHQSVSADERAGFTVHTVRSVSAETSGADLERVRERIGLPWPARRGDGVGPELGLARWRATMQARGHQMWCRLDGEDTLVTELWLRNPPGPRG